MYDDKYHFGRKYILKDFNNIYIRNKIRRIDKYFKTYHLYGITHTDNQLFIRSLQPISIFFRPIYTISLDFVVELSIVLSKNILWTIESFNIFDLFFINIYKTFKRKFLILDNKRYSIKDWDYILSRQLLLND